MSGSLDRGQVKLLFKYLKDIYTAFTGGNLGGGISSVIKDGSVIGGAEVSSGDSITKTSTALAVADTKAVQLHETDVSNLVTDSDIGTVDDTWVDQGIEINCQTYHTVGIWIDMTVSDSTGNQLQVLVKHTTGGVNEYVLESTSDYQKTIGDNDIKVFYQFNVENIPFIQVQTKATDVDTGGGTVGTITIDYTLDY